MKLSRNEILVLGRAYDQLEDSLIVLDEKFHILYLNEYAKKVLGMELDASLIGRFLTDVLNDYKLPLILDINNKFVNPESIRMNNCLKQWKLLSGTVDEKNSFFLLDKDVTEQEEMYSILEHAAQEVTGQLSSKRLSAQGYMNEVRGFLENIIKQMPCYVYWKDKEFRYIFCNDMTAEIMGINSSKDAIGKTDYEFGWDKKLVDIYRKTDEKIISTGKPVLNLEEDLINKDGRVYHTLVNKLPLKNKLGEIIGILGITVDISDMKEMEIALIKAKEIAENANKVKSEFIANMSHDIRTPLTGVVGMSQMLEDDLQNPDQKQYAQWIHQSGDQLLGLLNGILDVVSADHVNEQDIHEETFDLHQFIKDIVQLEHPSTELKGIDLNIFIDRCVPLYIKTDRTKLHRIILNLIGNAIKFTKIGGVLIEIKTSLHEDQKVKLHFRVIDTGIGIPLALQDKVFDRFFRVDPSYKGVYDGHGIGLHIAQSYVVLLGGKLKLTSKENVGTTFYFDLVCQIGKVEDVIISKSMLSPPVIKPLNNTNHSVNDLIDKRTAHDPESYPVILLVEDNCVALKILESMIKQANLQYISAIDGESALELAKTRSFDLIISDIGLPGITGNEFTHQFRIWEASQHKNPVPIVGLTAHAQGEIREECLQSGMNDVFSKPMLLPVLKKIIAMYVPSTVETETFNTQNKEEPGSGALGRDLPDTEGKLFELDAFPLLDIEHALDGLGNNKDLLTDILQSMINQEIPTEKAAIQAAYATKDWDTIEKLAHKMKGGAVYAGVVKMQYACQYLERYHKAGHTKLLEQLYQQMITVFDETHKAIIQWIQIKND